jgi:hypothetical protein
MGLKREVAAASNGYPTGCREILAYRALRSAENLSVRLEGSVRWIAAMFLGVVTAIATYLLLDLLGAGQATTPMTVLIFALALVAFGWALN